MKRDIKKFIGIKLIALVICGFFLFQTIGCGTLIYPERRGQKAGKVDVHVAILDGLGLLLFIIPGVVAYAVDFTTGAIFLPGSSKGSSKKKDASAENRRNTIVKLNADQMNKEAIARIVSQHAGQTVDLDAPDMRTFEAESADIDVFAELARLEASCALPAPNMLVSAASAEKGVRSSP